MGKTQEKDKVRPQMASLLAVATVFVGFWTQYLVRERGGAHTRDKIPV